jgi:hypothetical protein
LRPSTCDGRTLLASACGLDAREQPRDGVRLLLPHVCDGQEAVQGSVTGPGRCAFDPEDRDSANAVVTLREPAPPMTFRASTGSIGMAQTPVTPGWSD